MQVAESWQALLRVALLGTERAGSQLPPLPAQLDALLPTQMPAEQRLLAAAAQLAPLTRAGYMPAHMPDVAPVAPADTSTPVSGKAAAALEVLLNENLSALLLDWCELARATGRRVPPHLLPEFLHAIVKDPALREAGCAVQGERGAWLAAQHPLWQVLIAARTDTALWDTGGTEERAAVLRQIRAIAPARARELVEQVRESEPPDTLAQFVALLIDGLNLDDEALLESLLDAKHKPVRSAAAALLARLPQSAYCLRMQARLLPLVSFTGAQRGLIMKKKALLTVTLPQEPDKALIRDGIDGKKQMRELGRKALTLAQLFAATPLAALQAHCQCTPEEFITAAQATDEAPALIQGISLAVQIQRDTQWCKALLSSIAEDHKKKVQAVSFDDEADLIALLDAPARETALNERGGKHLPAHWLTLLQRAAPHAWSEKFSDWVMQSLLKLGRDSPWHVQQLAQNIAARSHPASARKSVQEILKLGEQATPVWHELIRLIELRLSYAEEFTR